MLMFDCQSRRFDVSVAVNLDDVLKFRVGDDGRSVRQSRYIIEFHAHGPLLGQVKMFFFGEIHF